MIRDNATRWNSFLNMLERFLNLRTYLNVIDVDGNLNGFNWQALQKLVDVLKPLKDEFIRGVNFTISLYPECQVQKAHLQLPIIYIILSE